MNQEYKCPYCGQDSYAKTSKNKGRFSNWDSIIRHLSSCTKVDYAYLISSEYGPILLKDFIKLSPKEVKNKYPKTRFDEKIKYLIKLGYLTSSNLKISFNKESIIKAIQNFVLENNKIPISRDFKNNVKYPGSPTVIRHFGSWNKAIEAAGFEPNIQNGFDIDTYGRDGHLYRSTAEAYFADNYLFNKVEYEIEPKYPKPYNKYYDWYLPTKNLYIELDGEIRPQVTKEKIEINKLLGRNCLFIKTSELLNQPSSFLIGNYVERLL